MRLSLPPLLLPVETRVRELDSKLLLAAACAERGFRVLLGSRTEMHWAIAGLPAGLYLAKDLHAASRRMHRILRDLGHRIVAADEEGLVRDGDDRYRELRVCGEVLRGCEAVICWGPDDAAALRDHPDAADVPLLPLGNPRVDLLRRELASFFRPEVEAIRARFGHPVLINTSFGHLNHVQPRLSVQRARAPRGRERQHELLRQSASFRRRIFEAFLELVPLIAGALPDVCFVVRPHPSENPLPWRLAAQRRANVHVVSEGNVVPWLLASQALIHSGCTTAIEAHLLGKPVLSFRPIASARFDRPLPEALSLPLRNVGEVLAALRALLRGENLGGECEELRALVARHLASLDGALAADRIAEALLAIALAEPEFRARGALARARGRLHARGRALVSRALRQRFSRGKNAAYQRHRFPDLDAAGLAARAQRLAKATGRFQGLRIDEQAPNLFWISPGMAA
jgi:surface carbohydrate biosynthesis protein